LLRAAFFALEPGQSGRLLLAIHHLVVDGVSWRILLEDLEAACRHLAVGEPVRLPAKTTSFKEWAERLQEHSRSTEMAAEVSWWLAAASRQEVRLPEDFPHGANTVAVARTLTVVLEPAETHSLLTAVPAAYRTRINDVLLTALGRALASWTGQRRALIDLEGHGREEIFPDVDLSRTAGWLTCVYPVRLEVTGGDPGADLKRIKEQLRGVPRAGLGYGMLRYLAAVGTSGQEPSALGKLAEAEIGFNYLGQLDRVLSAGSLFAPARESAGPAVSRWTARPHLLEINASVLEGRLRTSWSYSSAVHRPETIERLAAEYQEALRAIIAHCLSPEAGGATPSDFPLARIDQETLDRLLGSGARARRIEDIYPLSPLQQGMLFQSLYAPAAGAYIVQRSAELVGEMDVAAFGRAWQELIDRHAVLRTGFEWQDLDRPLQVVHRDVLAPLSVEDWSGLPEEERRQRADAWLAADLKNDFALQSPPLVRMALLRMAPRRHSWVWSGHHLLLDGWCMSLLFNELMSFYAAFLAGEEIRLPHARPYREYIPWLARQDRAAAESFWRRTLSGLTAPTELPLAHDPGGRLGEPERRRKETGHLLTDVTVALRELGRRSQLTLNTLVEG